MIGRDPKWVAAQIGHVNPKFTFSVYQLVATRRYIDEQAVWALMRFSDEPPSACRAARSRGCSGTRRGDPRGWSRASSTEASSASSAAPRTWMAATDREASFNPVINPVAGNLPWDNDQGKATHKKTPRFAGLS